MDEVIQGRPAAAGRGWPRRIARALLGSVLVVVVLAAVLAAVVWVVNRRDEPPSADAQVLDAIVASARPVPIEDDALAGLAALEAVPGGADAGNDAPATVAAGRRDVSRRTASRGDRLNEAFTACEMHRPDCDARLAAAEHDIASWVSRESGLLRAYGRVLPRRGWYEPPPPASAMDWKPPVSGAALEAQRVLLMQARLDARAGHADAVREAIDADARFWRSGLAGADTLMAKMTAAQALQRNLDLGLRALLQLPAGSVDAAVPASWKTPLSTTERSLLTVLAWEWKFGDNVARSMNGDPTSPPTSLFQLQATSNGNAAMMRRIAGAADAPFPALRDSLRRLDDEIADEGHLPFSLYNPIGRIHGAIAAPSLAGYARRIPDLEGQRRAVLAVAELHGRATGTTSVPAALSASAQRDPYTGRAFEWNAADRCVRVDGLDRSRGRRCLPYGGPRAAGAASTIH